MTIFSTQADPQPMAFTELSIYALSSSATIPTAKPSIDFCFCDYDCDYVATVLAGSDEYESDRTPFLLTNPDSSGTFEIYIQNIVTGVETQMTDNTYGTYFSLGYTVTNPDKGGYLVDWREVRDNLGFGRYKFRIVLNFFGDTLEETSGEYRLIPYSPVNANGTVKFETVRTGCIQGGIDYTDLDWVTSVRFKGHFYEIDPRIEIETYQTTNREVKQIQETTVRRFQLDTKLIPSSVLNDLKDDGLMATNIFITDYSPLAFEDLRQIEVVRTEFPEFQTFRNSRYGRFSIIFEEKLQNKIKRL